MVAGVAIFALYEVSTALSGREQRRVAAEGWGPDVKVDAKVRQGEFEDMNGVVLLLR